MMMFLLLAWKENKAIQPGTSRCNSRNKSVKKGKNMSLQITVVEKSSGVFVVTAIGSIDATSYEDFQTQVNSILQKRQKAIIFDLAGLDYINSFGLGIALKAKATMEKSGGDFGISNLQPQVKAAFEIIKALPKQNVFTSAEEMDQYLAQIQRQVKTKEGL